MSQVKTNEFEGDSSFGRHVNIGGNADVKGSQHIHKNLIVDGWLNAKNISGVDKGRFATADKLREAYPEPHDGWWAIVGTTMPGEIYRAEDGAWVATGMYESTGGGGGSGEIDIPIIRSTDNTTQPTDNNVLSALRALNILLSKINSDRTHGLLSSDVGFEAGHFVSGVSGGIIRVDEDGKSHAEVDYLTARIRAVFESLLAMEAKTIGGRFYISAGGGIKCTKVDEITLGGGSSAYRCWFLSADSDGSVSECRMETDDLAKIERFDAHEGENGRVESHYSWRRVVAVNNNGKTDEETGKVYGYIDLSVSDCDTGSDAPVAGDEICHFGSKSTDPADAYRKTVLMLSAVGDDAPCIKMFVDVDDYTLADCDVISLGFDNVECRVFFRLGKNSDKHYLNYRQGDGLDLAGRLHISSTLGDSGSTLGQTITATDIYFTLSDSATDAPALPSINEEGLIEELNGWTTTAPASQEGMFLWQTTYERKADGSARFSNTACVSGRDGRGITSVREQYYLSTSRVFLTGGQWSNTPPEWVSGRYYWTRICISYTDGTTDCTEPVCVQGSDGTPGADGSDAYRIDLDNESAMIACDSEGNVTGVYPASRVSVWHGATELTIANGGVTGYTLLSSGIVARWADYDTGSLSTESMTSDTATVKVTATLADGNTLVATMHIAKVRPGKNGSSVTVSANSVTYQVSTDGTNPPDGEWLDGIPDVPEGQYLWTKTVVTYSDNTSTTSYSVSRCGADGNSLTIKDKEVLYCVGDYPSQPQDFRFTLTSLNGITLKQGDYIWTKIVVTYSDDTELKSYSVSRIGMDGADGIGLPGDDGKTSYVHFAYCSSIDGSLPHPTSVSGFSTTSFAGAKYIGVCTDYTQADPTPSTSDVCAVYQWNKYSGEDGKDGEDAVLYEIIPSSNQVTCNAEGELSASTVSCTVYEIAGKLRRLSNAHRLRAIKLPAGAVSQLSVNTLGASSGVQITSDVSAVRFELYDTVDGAELIYDRETVPVLVDAAGFVGGDNILKGTNQGVKCWSTDTYAGGNTVSPMLLSPMQQAPFGLSAINNARYPYGGTAGSSSTIPSEIYYRLFYRLDSEFRLEADTNYILSFDMVVNSKGLTYLTVDGFVNASNTVPFGDGWLWNASTSGYHPVHMEVPLNFPDDVEGLSSLRFTFGNRETNVVDTSVSGSAARSKGEFYGVQVSNLKLERGHRATPWTASPRETNYLMEALQQDITMEGGLILAALIKLGYTDSNGQWKVGAGINGMLSPNASDAARKSLIMLWSGGDQIDAAVSPDDLNAATFLVRADGSVYCCRNIIRFLEGRMEMGDDLIVDSHGLYLRDQSSGEIYFRLTNESVGDEASMLERSVVNVSPASATFDVKVHTASGGGSGIQLIPGYYIVGSASDSLYTLQLNGGSQISSHGANLDLSIGVSLNYGNGNANYQGNFDMTAVLEKRTSSAGSWTTAAQYGLRSATDGTVHSASCHIMAALDGGCYYRLRIKPASPVASTYSYSNTTASLSLNGKIYSGNSSTTLQGNDGFATAWPDSTLLMAKAGRIVAQVSGIGIRIIKDGSTPRLQFLQDGSYYNFNFAKARELGIITSA